MPRTILSVAIFPIAFIFVSYLNRFCTCYYEQRKNKRIILGLFAALAYLGLSILFFAVKILGEDCKLMVSIPAIIGAVIFIALAILQLVLSSKQSRKNINKN